ncbi:hypothetical protein Zmor_003354 [Zophobas morio]|uniref:Uncharacterized protein n=1 Tax=Zophobas morio TaxID=2755281 RepID=A0AA38HS60_9CUCU|nr:hypothetical protein Zmor_003354 [Zophobas morio]
MPTPSISCRAKASAPDLQRKVTTIHACDAVNPTLSPQCWVLTLSLPPPTTRHFENSTPKARHYDHTTTPLKTRGSDGGVEPRRRSAN